MLIPLEIGSIDNNGPPWFCSIFTSRFITKQSTSRGENSQSQKEWFHVMTPKCSQNCDDKISSTHSDKNWTILKVLKIFPQKYDLDYYHSWNFDNTFSLKDNYINYLVFQGFRSRPQRWTVDSISGPFLASPESKAVPKNRTETVN